MSIFSIPDLDQKLLEQLDIIKDYHRMKINKYYYELIKSQTLYTEWIKLYNYTKNNRDIHISFDNDLFINSCRLGCSISKYLIKTYSLINIHFNNEAAFKGSCENGHLKLAQWLLWQGAQPGFTLIDIHAYNEYAFRYSCQNGHLKLAQWLLWQSAQPGFTLINIHANIDYAFRSSCSNDHLMVAQWLLWQAQERLINVDALINIQYF